MTVSFYKVGSYSMLGIAAINILIIGKILLIFYFLHAAVKNIIHFSQRAGFLQSKRVPLPKIALSIGILLQIVGSLTILFNYYAALGAILLIIFTLVCN